MPLDSETCLKSSGKWCSLTVRGKKSSLGAEFEGPPGLLRKPYEYSRFPRSSQAFWVLMGPKRTPNDQVMTVLANTGPLYGSPWNNFIFSRRPKFCVLHSGDIVSTYILTDARNALLLLAVTHVRYAMPHGKNKENKAYSRLIFLSLQPNGIPRIIDHVQNATFVHTRWTNVYTHHSLSDFLSMECQWFQKLGWKTATNDVLWLSGAKSPA